jgi:Cell division control protein 14, SIN component
LDGLLVVTSLFKARTTSREIKLKLVEFLYFYLMPETPPARIAGSTSATNTAVLGGRGRELIAAFDRRRETVGGGEGVEKVNQKTRTTEDKQRLLGKHLSNVQDLVEDLREGGGLFGGNV